MKEKKVNKIDLDELINKVRSSYGKDKSRAQQISTGSNIVKPTRDEDFICWPNSPWELLTGVKGIAFGKQTQISGKVDSGKSSHAMQFMKLAQDQGVLCILWDTESKWSPRRFSEYFKGNSDELIVVSSKMILEGGNEVERVVHAVKEMNPDQKILIVWDSVGGALPTNEAEDTLGESKQMAAAAKENGQIVRAFNRLMEKYKNREKNEETIAVLLINQTYSAVGKPGQIESGGNKVAFASSLTVQLGRVKDLSKVIKGVKYKIGIVTRAKVKKNHLFDSDRNVAELDLVVTAGGIDLLSAQKVKNKSDDSAWDDSDDGEVELESD